MLLNVMSEQETRKLRLFFLLVVFLAASASAKSFTLRAPFSKWVPKKYTCDGRNISPPIFIKNPPKKAKSLALIVEDPDAPSGAFTHWILYNIPVKTKKIQPTIPRKRSWHGWQQGKNSFGKFGYSGPCPPRHHGVHRYFFTLYALSTRSLKAKPNLSPKKMKQSIRKHALRRKAVFMAKYKR